MAELQDFTLNGPLRDGSGKLTISLHGQYDELKEIKDKLFGSVFDEQLMNDYSIFTICGYCRAKVRKSQCCEKCGAPIKRYK